METKNVRISISPQAIWVVLGCILGLWLIYQLREIIVLFLMVLAVTVAFSPIVKAWERFIGRTVAIVLVYVLVVALLVAVVALFLPPVLSQLSDLIDFIQQKIIAYYGTNDLLLDDLRRNVNLFISGGNTQSFFDSIKQIQGSFGAVFSTTLGVIGGFIAMVTVFISSFYLLVEEKNLDHFLSGFLTPDKRARVARTIDKISQKVGDWLRGQVVLMLIIGVVNGVGLALIGVPYPLLLGLWAGLTEAVPVIGPILGAIPAVILAFSVLGWVKALIVLALFVIVQQIENNILVPRIMGRALGLSPVMIIFSLLVWGKLLGFIGIVIAIPVTAVLFVLIQELRYPESTDKLKPDL